MKKKIVAIVLSLGMILSMTACGGKGKNDTDVRNDPSESSSVEESMEESSEDASKDLLDVEPNQPGVSGTDDVTDPKAFWSDKAANLFYNGNFTMEYTMGEDGEEATIFSAVFATGDMCIKLTTPNGGFLMASSGQTAYYSFTGMEDYEDNDKVFYFTDTEGTASQSTISMDDFDMSAATYVRTDGNIDVFEIKAEDDSTMQMYLDRNTLAIDHIDYEGTVITVAEATGSIEDYIDIEDAVEVSAEDGATAIFTGMMMSVASQGGLDEGFTVDDSEMSESTLVPIPDDDGTGESSEESVESFGTK